MKTKTTKTITTKQAWRCKQKTPKSKGTKLTKENKSLTYFKSMFPFLRTSENMRGGERKYWVKVG